MINPGRSLLAIVLTTVVAAFAVSCGSDDTVILATGTTAQDTGLLDALVPLFEEESGYNVKVIAVGTGQALQMGRRGDADVLFAHDPASEQAFVDEGYGTNRQLVMHNDFIIVGPANDPAGVRRANDGLSAMHAIRKSEAAFVSRGDDSGTHKLELALWDEVDFDPGGQSWYAETGQGMGATLQVAGQRDAYTISDRGTFLALRDTLDLEVLFEGDPKLINIYHVLQVNPGRVDGVNADGAAAFVAFMVSAEAQALIGEFGVERFGRPLFIPDAGKTEDELREAQ